MRIRQAIARVLGFRKVPRDYLRVSPPSPGAVVIPDSRRSANEWGEGVGHGKSDDVEAIHRQLLQAGRDLSVNVNAVPVRNTATPLHRCVENLDFIGGGGAYPYECLVCGKRLSALDVADEEGGEE